MKYNLHSIRLIVCPVPVLKANKEWQIKGQDTEAQLDVHLKDVLDHFMHTDGHFLGITTDIASSHYSTTRELQSTLEACRIE